MKRLLGATAAAALVFVAAFLPWATITGTARPIPERLTGDPLRMEAIVNAWRSHVLYGDFEVPNAFVVVAAAGAAAACWLRASARRNVPSAVPIGLALCGLVHTLCFLAILIRSRAGTIGLGAVLTVAGMVALLLLALTQRPAHPSA